MGFKRGVLVGMGVGYVLGTRAGRQRYEQIRRSWHQLTGSTAVQRATERTKELAGQQARATLHAVQGQVEKAGSAVKDRLTRSEGPDSGHVAERMRDDQRIDLTDQSNPIASETSP